MSLEAAQRAVAEDLAAVDRIIRTSLRSDVVLIGQVAEHIVSGGGKRVRPTLVLLSATALDYAGTLHHHLAAVVEFIHTATLLHDDVVDDSSLRRGRATSNALFGNAAAVLVGDFLYSRAFQMMVDIGRMRVMEVLAEATNVIAEGEVMQLMNCHDADVDEARYLEVVRCKTAKLFEASTRLGAIVAGVDSGQERAMAAFGMHLGTAFQLVDDVLDYSGNLAEMGKNVGDDLAEGKTTLPLIHAMRNGTPEQSALVRRAIEHGGLDELEPVVRTIEETGALDYARARAREEAKRACEALSIFPRSKYVECLIDLAAFSVDRAF